MVKIIQIINEEFIAPNECLAVIFADSKEELSSEYSVSGLPTGRTLAQGSKFKIADGSEGYLKSDGTIEWVVESSDLPPVDSSDNGKVLVVEDGQWAVGETPVTPEDIQQAVNAYCAANFSEWAGGLDSGLTQPLMAAPADKVGELKSALSELETNTVKYSVQYLTDNLKQADKYYSYNSETDVITQYPSNTLCCFTFNLKAGTYYYGKLYGGFYRDNTTNTVTNLTDASARQTELVLAHETTLYVNVGNSNYGVSAYVTDNVLLVDATAIPSGKYGYELSNSLQNHVNNGIEYSCQYTSQGFYNRTISLTKGDVITVTATRIGSPTGSISVRGIKSDSSYVNLTGNLHEGESENIYIEEDFVGLRFVASVPTGTGIFSFVKRTELWKTIWKNPVFYCGSGRTLNTLKKGVEYATKFMNATLYVDAGTYDLISEFGADYFENLTSSDTLSGLRLKNGIRVVFSPNSKVTSNYTGDNEYAQSLYSPFNCAAYGFTMENLTLEASKCRYCVHDERNGNAEQYKAHYINCNMKIDNSENDYWNGRACIGGGLGSNAEIIVEGCTFDNDDDSRGGVYYHQSNKTSETNYKSNVTIKNNYFVKGCVQIDDGRTGSVSGNTIYKVTNNCYKKYTGTNDEGVFDMNLTSSTSVLCAWNNVVRVS